MKIAYITHWDTSDINAWSGVVTNLLKILQDSGFEVEVIDNLNYKYSFLFKIKKLFYKLFLSQNYLRDREPIILKSFARQIQRKLQKSNCEIILCPSSIPVAFLNTEKPIIIWTDATFAGLLDFYESFSNLCAETIKNGNYFEQKSLDKASLIIYENTWAKETAVEFYNINENKMGVIPFGSNVLCDRTPEDIVEILKSKNSDNFKLLFIGADWKRKGGDFAVDVCKRLNERGIKAVINMIGEKPKYNLPDYVFHHGFISRKTDEGRALFDSLIKDSNFFILPTKADAMPLVFGDVCSYGLPCLTFRVGGTEEAIKDGLNGQTFNLDAEPDEYCDYIETVISSPDMYHKLSLSSFKEYEDRLNWKAAGTHFVKLIENL